MIASQVSVSVAFLAGLASFLSPCVLPLVPIYLAQLVGQSVYQASDSAGEVHDFERPARLNTFLHALVFVAGFTVAFVSLGATASALGAFLRIHQFVLRQVGGVLLVIIGLHLTGIFKLPFLYRTKRFQYRPNRPGYAASFLIGLIFAIGWTPCVGPILAVILGFAAEQDSVIKGIILLAVYSLGLAVPFLLTSLGIERFLSFYSRFRAHMHAVEVASGVLLIALGGLLVLGRFTLISNYLSFLNRFAL